MSSNNVNRLLFKNGVVSSPPSDTPPVTTLLQAHPGAYTTTRTQRNGSELLFWERHLSRLRNSVRILINSKPEFFIKPGKNVVQFNEFLAKSSMWESMVRALVNDSMKKALPVALEERKCGEEMAVTALVSGNLEVMEGLDEERVSGILDVYLHFGYYVPPVFGSQGNGARLAVVGHGRDVANAKYSGWVRHRKQLEKLRAPLITELLLSNDGDHILEGSVTNFFVVCRKDYIGEGVETNAEVLLPERSFEILTAPLGDGVLPGVIRQVIIDTCLRNGIQLREVAPSWAHREMWVEAFITSSLRLLQHVESILAPSSWDLLESKTWEDVTWVEKQFQESPGMITSIIKKEIMEKAGFESYPVTSFTD